MKITVNKDNVKIEEFDIVHEGEHRVNKCSFSFSEEYTEELVKKAIFTSQNSSVEVAIINNECNIPTEILKARNIVLLGVYAYKVVDDKLDLRYSPSPDAFKVNSGSYIEGASESEEITPSQFEQYMQALNDGLNKVEESLKKMDSATSSATQLVDDINQKLENGEFIGPEGPQGPQGIPGKDGIDGINGQDGVGITTITSGQSSVEEDKTITPITVNKTDGSSQIFKVEAKNGLDGQNGKDGKDGVNGQDGLTPTIGENGNWFLGDTDTGKPSRGEVGPSPDLSNYVKNTDYATNNKTGVINGNINGFQVSSSGNPYAKEYTAEEYDNVGNQDFIGKGTLENIKDDYVESSTPVKNLNTSLIDITPKNNAEGTDNIFDDGLESPLYALGGDGKSEQVVTTGKQLFDKNNVLSDYRLGSDGIQFVTEGYSLTDFIEVKPSTNYYRNIDITLMECVCLYDANKTFISRLTSGKGFMTTEDTYYLRTDVATEKLDITMLAEGITETEYEPYTGLNPSPSPDYPQPINSIEGSLEFACSGKNLCDGVNQNYYLNNKVNLCGQNVGDSGLAINVSQYSQLTVSTQSIQERYRVGCVDSLPTGSDFSTIPVFNGVNKDGTNDSITVDTTDYNYLIVNATNLSVIQVEEGSVATEIKPYIEPNQVTFNLGQEKLRSVGDVKDELVVNLETGDYYKVENVGEVVFDGSDDEGWYKTGNTNVNRFGIVLNRISGAGVMSNKWIMSNIDVINLNYILDYVDNTSIYVNFSDISENDDLATFKSWLSVNKPIVDYLLQNPTTKKLGTLSSEDLAKLKTFKGYNNVTVNTNLGFMNIRFTYGLDIKKYVDNKIAELSAQLIKGE